MVEEVIEMPEPEPEIVVTDVVVSEDVALVEIAQEVVSGRWGRGKARKQRLRDAGFDPDAVQHEVDKIFNQK